MVHFSSMIILSGLIKIFGRTWHGFWSAAVMAVGRASISSVILLSSSLLASFFVNLYSPKLFENAQVYYGDKFYKSFNSYTFQLIISSRKVSRFGSHFVTSSHKKFQKSRVAYYSNCTASFNPVALSVARSGDIHPHPGPNRQCNSAKFYIPKGLKANVKVAHLNVRSLKSREQFCLVKDTILHNTFDIFTISETWLDLTVPDACVEISGYQLFRQDHGPYKDGGSLCIYAKSNLKVTLLEDLSFAYEDGFQLRLKEQ